MNKPIILFDGFCNLCDSMINFILKEDKKDLFRFSAIQSDFTKKIISDKKLDSEYLKTIILIYNDKIYFRSDAVLKILILLGGYFKLFAYIFIIIPTPIRDLVYNFIAKKRYLWFGKKENCIISYPDVNDKFI